MPKTVIAVVRAATAQMFVSLAILYSFGTASALETEQSSDEQFKAKEEQAFASERNHEKCAMHLWNQLANAEIGAGLTSAGLKHERHAMQLFSLENDVGVGVLGECGGRIIPTLTGQGHSAEAEKLLVEAVERTKSVAGPKSVATQAQIGDLFVFYVTQGKYPAAMNTLDRVLDFDLGNGASVALTHFWPNTKFAQQPGTSVRVLHGILRAIAQVEKTDPSFAITAIKKVLKAQEACLTSDDERLVETLAALGDAFFQARKCQEAHGYYSRAYEITSHFYPEGSYAVQQCGKNFLDNLKKTGHSEEVDRLLKLKSTSMQPLQPQAFPLVEPPQS
jgi:tetratricopeptide (TPR) repeat protein